MNLQYGNSDGGIVAYKYQNVSTFVYETHINESFEGGTMMNASTPMDTKGRSLIHDCWESG
jgi:hypothetical protein